MVVGNVLDLLEPLMDTLERLPEEMELESIRVNGTAYDTLVTVDLAPDGKPGESLKKASLFLRERIRGGARGQLIEMRVPGSCCFCNGGDVFIDFRERGKADRPR